MKKLIAVLAAVVLVSRALAGDAPTPAVKAEPVKMNPKLAGLGDNTWVKVAAGRRGGDEAGPLTSIEKCGLLFKYGGCGDMIASYGIDYASQGWTKTGVYSNGCWGLDAAGGQWKVIRPFDPKFPEDRPGNGCSRGHCYDSKRGLVWMYGAEAGHNGSNNVWSLWTYDAGQDKFELAAPPPPPRKMSKTMVYDSANDLLVFTSGATTWVFHCDTKKWEGRSTPGAPGTGSYNAAAFDAENKKVVLPLAQPTGQESDKKEADTRTTIWKPLEKGGKKLWQEFAFNTWTYDAAANKWEKLEIKPEDAPPPRCRHGVTYDSLNKVVIMAAGSTDTWDSGEKH